MQFQLPNRNFPDQAGAEIRSLKDETVIMLTTLVRKDALLTCKL